MEAVGVWQSGKDCSLVSNKQGSFCGTVGAVVLGIAE